MSFITKTATHTVITTPAENGGVNAVTSIRQLMMTGILEGRAKEAIKADIDRLHPGSAASSKFAKHYGWYKSTMKKDGLLAGSAAKTTETLPVGWMFNIEETPDVDMEALYAEAIAEAADRRVAEIDAELAKLED